MGADVRGAAVGAVGALVGKSVGWAVVGRWVVGADVGVAVGAMGATVGVVVGKSVGWAVVGTAVGAIVGCPLEGAGVGGVGGEVG